MWIYRRVILPTIIIRMVLYYIPNDVLYILPNIIRRPRLTQGGARKGKRGTALLLLLLHCYYYCTAITTTTTITTTPAIRRRSLLDCIPSNSRSICTLPQSQKLHNQSPSRPWHAHISVYLTCLLSLRNQFRVILMYYINTSTYLIW